MKEANLFAVEIIMGELRREVKRFTQISLPYPSSCSLENNSQVLLQLEKGSKILDCKRTIFLLSCLLARLREVIPDKDRGKMVKGLMKLFSKTPPDESEISVRTTLGKLIQTFMPEKK